MTWQGILIIVGLAGALAGLIILVLPVPRLWSSHRRRAGFLLAAGLLVAVVGFASVRCGCVLPPIDPRASSIGRP